MPLLLAGAARCNLRGCDWSGVFVPHVLIVFLLLMQTLSVITFSSDWKLQALLNKNTAKEWNVYPLLPHYKAFRNQTIRPNAVALNNLIPTPFSDVWTLRQNAGFPVMIIKLEENVVTLLVLCRLHCQCCHSDSTSRKSSFQDVKPETTIWFRSRHGGPNWGSWLRWRRCCLPGTDTVISVQHYIVFKQPHLPPRVQLKEKKRLSPWGPTAR